MTGVNRLFRALCLAGPLVAVPAAADALKLEVTELAQSVDLSRGKEKFLTVTVDVIGTDPVRLRRVQPLRDDFQLLAGKATLPCRWLRGGSIPEDTGRLRFTLGFSTPPEGVKKVSLRANLPRLEGEDVLELRLTGLQLGQKETERKGTGWTVTINQLEEREYVVPALPPKGGYISKGGPVDARVFRKMGTGEPVPDRAIVLSLFSRDVELYDRTLDVSGSLLIEGGAPVPLISASMRRDPSRSVEKPPYPPFITASFHFGEPGKGRITGAVLRLHRRPPNPAGTPITIADLPVP